MIAAAWLGWAWGMSCALPPLFALSDTSTSIAVVDVAAGSAAVVEVWKGEAARPALAVGDPWLPAGRAVAFDGDLGPCARVLRLSVDADRRLADALRVWLALDGAEARAEALVGWGVGTDETLASEALARLASRPDLLAVIDAEQRLRLVEAVPQALGERAYPLSWTLARLHATESLPAWIAWLDAPRSAVAYPIVDAMQLMTHHRPSGRVPGAVHGAALVAVREDFTSWWATWRGRPVEEALAEGARQYAPDDPLAVAVRRNRCEIAARLEVSSMPEAARRGPPQARCP